MAKREWTIEQEDYDTEEAFRGAVEIELARLENLGHRLGGVFVVAPLRQLLEDDQGNVTGSWTRGWVFRHENAPAIRQKRPEARVEMPLPEPEPEFDEVEPALTGDTGGA